MAYLNTAQSPATPKATVTPPTQSTTGREVMNRKPVLYREAKTVLTLNAQQFHEKLLCDGITFNPGDACAYSCEFCYVGAANFYSTTKFVKGYNSSNGSSLKVQDLVIRRRNVAELLRAQLLRKGAPRYSDPNDNRVVFGSTLVDVAANMELLRETAEACNLIFEHTHWQVRLLTKSNLLHKLVEDGLVPERFHSRLILGFSTGTLDDRVAQAIETGTPMVSKRLQSLHWLQDRGLRTFGMICPSLPQDDYQKYSREMCAAIRADRCEHVWAEVINLRGKSLARTVAALEAGGFKAEAAAMTEVSNDKKKWETYARATFTAHAKHIPPDKLRFLQYITRQSAQWWADQRGLGALLLGETAEELHLTATGVMSAAPVRPNLTSEDSRYLREREDVVTHGVRASIAAAKALFEIHRYKDGLLWRRDHKSFEAYCRAKWDYGKPHAYRLVECGDLVIELEKKYPKGYCLPQRESQVRPLLTLPRESRVAAWEAVVVDVKPEELTGRVVAAKVRAHVEANDIPVRTRASKRGSKAKMAAAALARLREATQGHKREQQLGLLLDQVARMLK